MGESIVITGIGMVTPLGDEPCSVLRRIRAGESAAAAPTRFDSGPFACPVCAEVKDFRPRQYVAEPKLIRLMNRDAQLAVAAVGLAVRDAGLGTGPGYAPEEIALYGATGLAGLPLAEIAPLLKASTTAEGRFALDRFGQEGLRSVSPVLSFKILSNMPLCFVSICHRIQGPNAIYTPWEGQGAQAIEAGLRTVRGGESRCALVGGCDVKTHELAFLTLEQMGLFRSWAAGPPDDPARGENAEGRDARLGRPDDAIRQADSNGRARLSPSPGYATLSPSEGERDRVRGRDPWRERLEGVIPAEGAVFLVLETERGAAERGARVYATLSACGLSSASKGEVRTGAQVRALGTLRRPLPTILIGAAEADAESQRAELETLERAAVAPVEVVHPKPHVGNLFAAAAALQVALGALTVAERRRRVLAHCFGHGTEQAAFVLDPA